LFDLFFDPEDGGDIFLRNIRPSSNDKSLQTQKTALFIVTAVRASNPALKLFLLVAPVFSDQRKSFSSYSSANWIIRND
jgi:hypothetical protein